MVICLERGADLHMAQLMPLPLTVSCFSKIQFGFVFLVPAHPGSPGKRPLNVCVFYHFLLMGCLSGYLSGARCRFCIWSSCHPKTVSSLVHLNSDWFYLSGTGLPRLSWKEEAVQRGVVVVLPFLTDEWLFCCQLDPTCNGPHKHYCAEM